MNRYAFICICALVVGVGIAGVFLMRGIDPSETTVSHPSGQVTDAKAAPSRHQEPGQADDSKKASPGVRNENNDVPQTAVPSEEAVGEKVLSAVLAGLTGQSAQDNLSEEELLYILSDRDSSEETRRRAAWHLAKYGSEAAINELEKLLLKEEVPLYLKVSILEGLGHSSEPKAKQIILTALDGSDDIVVRGAIRGLSAVGDSDAVTILSEIMASTGVPENVKAEAAAGLGKMDHPDAYRSLLSAYDSAGESGNAELRKDIIAALGYKDIAETAEFFKEILENQNSDPDLRIAAIEAMGDAQGNISTLLLAALNDEDSEVRAETAWALAVADDPGDIAERLQGRLLIEGDSEVRKRLYQALSNQEGPDINAVAGLIYEESDTAARLAGYDLLAKNVDFVKDTVLQEKFEKTAIPDLKGIALSDDNLNYRLSAVIALKRAGTVASVSALEEIAAKSLDKKVIEATEINR